MPCLGTINTRKEIEERSGEAEERLVSARGSLLRLKPPISHIMAFFIHPLNAAPQNFGSNALNVEDI